MSNPIDYAQHITGWDPSVISYLHDEFIETEDGGDFAEYLAEQVATAAFVIGASNGLGVSACLEAYAHGLESVLNEEFDVNEAIDAINLAESDYLPDEE
jgi:hypothetical protein